ncbi:hypothetical protein [Streptomyces sp. NPDC050560]|uniref:hypothetical protein n=1 Tax=Streptomyces sp. NPDC050560 TaxID=3365630 RepID=UPI0037B246A9
MVMDPDRVMLNPPDGRSVITLLTNQRTRAIEKGIPVARPSPDLSDPATREFWKERTSLTFPEDQVVSARQNDKDMQEAWRRGMVQAAPTRRFAEAARNQDGAWAENTAEKRSQRPRVKNEYGIYAHPEFERELRALADMMEKGRKFGELVRKYGSEDAALQRKVKDYWRPMTRQEYQEKNRKPLAPPDGYDALGRVGLRFDHFLADSARRIGNALQSAAGRRPSPGPHDQALSAKPGPPPLPPQGSQSAESVNRASPANDPARPPAIRNPATAPVSSLLPPGSETQRLRPVSPTSPAAAQHTRPSSASSRSRSATR